MDGGISGCGADGLDGVSHGGPVVQFAHRGEPAARVDARAEVDTWLIGCRRDDEGHLKDCFVAEGVRYLHGKCEGAGL